MVTVPASVITTRASDVVCIAFAKTARVSLFTVSSNMPLPGFNDLIEVLEDNLPDLAPQARRTVIFELLTNVEAIWKEPIFTFRISLCRVYVHRLCTFVRVEKQSPPLHEENGWHQFAIPL